MSKRKTNHTTWTLGHSEHISKEFDYPTFNTKALAALKVWENNDFEFPAPLSWNHRSEKFWKFSGKFIWRVRFDKIFPFGELGLLWQKILSTETLWLVLAKFVQKFQKCDFGLDLTFLHTNGLKKHQKCNKNRNRLTKVVKVNLKAIGSKKMKS